MSLLLHPVPAPATIPAIVAAPGTMTPASARRVCIAAAIMALVLPLHLSAQPRTAADSAYLRAHRLVAEGRGEAGRALVDSMLRSAAPGSAAYAEGLFWRAATATRGDDAERDYLRIAIEYPLSPRAEDALVRLAEIEMARGERVAAQRHLQRLVIEYPGGASRARASYWLARLFFEANEIGRACHELNTARSRAAPDDVELRNQVEYEAQRCAGVEGTALATGAPPASLPPPAGAATSSASPPAGAATVPPPRPDGARMYTVQVAAFPARDAAVSFMESLQARGYDVRVWGNEAPFRVRIGRFATRGEASAMAAELRARMISRDAWVTEAEVR